MKKKDESRAAIAVRAAGWVLVAASIAYIAHTITRSPLGSISVHVTAGSMLAVIFFAVAYSILNILLAYCWALIAGAVSPGGPPVPALVRIHLKTGIVKYLPGNVFHLAGRHVLAGNAGMGQWAVLATNIVEMGTIVAAALATIAVTAGSGRLGDAFLLLRGRIDPALAFIAAVAGMGAAVGIMAFLARRYRMRIGLGSLRTLAGVFAGYLVFFAAASLLLYGLFARISPAGSEAIGYIPVLGVFCLSWVAGFVVPGAPGGLGIREAVIVATLSAPAGEGAALAAALLLRVITVGGDLLSFCYSFWRRRG